MFYLCNGSGGGWGGVLAFVSGMCVNDKGR